jgi:phenylpropionate dioxygenase-like ring-hydroxylating dioxygenase large terminal subunit
MFLSTGASAFLLEPRDYSAADTFAAEQRAIFAASWNLVGAHADLARAGDQLATEVGGVPVLVRNDGGELRAFRNVCPHRHSLVAPPGRSFRPKLKCQYHGWEFAADGRLSHLPDGRSFRGWKATDACLDPVRCESRFGLVFVNPGAGADGASLAAEHGPIADELAHHFDGLELRWVQVTEHDVNWKIIVENAVESYHVPMVHPGTFVTYGREEAHRHLIEPTFTQFEDLDSSQNLPLSVSALDELLFRTRRSYGYAHTHLYPNHLITYAGFYREWVVVEPLGPRRSRRLGYGFLPRDLRLPGPTQLVGRLALAEIARRTRRSADRILGEDSSVWTSIQRGTESSRFAGVLSAREERVAAFQRWVVTRLGRATPPPG